MTSIGSYDVRTDDRFGQEAADIYRSKKGVATRGQIQNMKLPIKEKEKGND